jgi:hypothetical protein
MLREETSDHGAKYIIFFIWGDDPIRSLMRCRYCSIHQWFKNGGEESGENFHANFWAHVEIDLESGEFIEIENPLSTAESLYRMTEPEWLIDHLKEDLALELDAYANGRIRMLDRSRIARLATVLNFDFDWSADSEHATAANPDPRASSMVTPMQAQAAALLNRYAQAANIFVLDKVRSMTKSSGRELLVVVFDPFGAMQQMYSQQRRDDQESVDYLIREHVNYFDLNEAHIQDFGKYRISWDAYMNQFFLPHYNPIGNHFFAYSIKDKVIDWLDPKPITYQDPDMKVLDFNGYLRTY